MKQFGRHQNDPPTHASQPCITGRAFRPLKFCFIQSKFIYGIPYYRPTGTGQDQLPCVLFFVCGPMGGRAKKGESSGYARDGGALEHQQKVALRQHRQFLFDADVSLT